MIYCAGDKTEKNDMGGACSADGEGTGVYRVLVGKPEGKKPLGRLGHIWKDNIKMDLHHVGLWAGVSWLKMETGGGHL
jgi:hypothetical protein